MDHLSTSTAVGLGASGALIAVGAIRVPAGPLELGQRTNHCRQDAMREVKAAQLADRDPGDVVVLVRCTVGGRADPLSDLPDAHVKGDPTTVGMQDAQPGSGLRHDVHTELLVHLTREGL